MSISRVTNAINTATSRSPSPEAPGTSGSPRTEGLQPTEAKRPASSPPPEGLSPSKPARTSASDTSLPSLVPRRQIALPREQPELPTTSLISSQASALNPAESGATAKRILAGVIDRLRLGINATDGTDRSKGKKLEHLQVLEQRAFAQVERLSSNLQALYGGRHDVPAVLEKMLEVFIAKGLERPDELKLLDAARAHDPNWFSSNKSIASTLYVDRHCGTLSGLEKEIGYFKLMNINMLHLMPTIYKTPEKDNDGGYAISDFRALNPAIGTMDELRDLFGTMRKHGISPIMDVTINHVADDHEWAQAAKKGDPERLAHFFVMNEAEKNEYDKDLPPMFPDIRAGSFTKNDDVGGFVLTSFMSTQWDLNYSNPKTLLAMTDELLFILNQGAEVLRMDAVPHIWKKKGTGCKGLPETQDIVGIFNTMSKIAAPGAILLSETIDVPEMTKRYLGPDKCQMGYNVMTLTHLWDSLVHEDASFMAETLKRHADTPEGTALLNMARTHDNAPFAFDPGAAGALGIDIKQRHESLGDFFFGDHYAKAVPFNASDKSGYVSVSGTMGSLTGLEKAIETGDTEQADAAIKRIRLLNGLLLSLPGVPMLNLTGGDDRGQINDYSFMKDEIQSKDSRWVHRVKRDVDFKTKSSLEVEVMGHVFSDTVDLNRARTEMPAFGAGPMQVIDTGKPPVLAFARENEQQKVVVLANFSPTPQKVDAGHLHAHGMTDDVVDKIGPQKDQVQQIGAGIELAPYQCMWLVPADRGQPQPRAA